MGDEIETHGAGLAERPSSPIVVSCVRHWTLLLADWPGCSDW